MQVTRAVLGAAVVIGSVTAYHFNDRYGIDSLSRRDVYDVYEQELSIRELDEFEDWELLNTLMARGTIKRPNLQGNLRLSPQDIARANGQAATHQQQISAPLSPAPPRNNAGSYFGPNAAAHAGPSNQGGGSRRSSQDSMRSLFGTP